MIRQIRSLLYEQGYTIGGARTLLARNDNKNSSVRAKQLIQDMLADLEALLQLLQ
jgi:hypothetical protein